MVIGPYRLSIVQILKEQANESLLHAQQAGELLTGLGGHPSQKVAHIEETHQHNIRNILEESLQHEQKALSLYKDLLQVVTDHSIYLEEYARTMIAGRVAYYGDYRRCYVIINSFYISQSNRFCVFEICLTNICCCSN